MPLSTTAGKAPPPGRPRPLGFADVGAEDLAALKEWLAAQLAGSTSLCRAAQRFATAVGDRFPSTVLIRLYGTVPFGRLPAREQTFASDLGRSRGVAALHRDTPVLVLFGSRGRHKDWNDRYNSRGHLAIPLWNENFVDQIPMLASLLREIGLDLSWLDSPGDALTRRLVGGFNGVFYVPNARVGRDAKGRMVIPAQDFVSSHDIKSVFGMGGAYPYGHFVSAIIFTTESLPREAVARLAPLISVFKSATLNLVSEDALFEG